MSMSPTVTLFLSLAAATFILMTLRRFIAKKQAIAPAGGRLKRWADRLKSREWRRYGFVLAAGKLAGLALVAGVIFYFNPGLFGHKVFAADVVLTGNDIVNPVNTAWTLVAAFLVFGMQVGFTMLEAGFCRSRETVNVLMECIVDTCLCGILFYAIGFSFMFSHGNGFIGYHWFFLQGTPATYETSGVVFLALWIFQFAFADTCSTITSGAMIGRTGFVGDLLYSVGVSGFIYPIIGHWAWGPDGFLATMGSAGFFLPNLGQSFHDFAGSTVVHTIGGFVALAGAIVLGPRLGRKFKRDGGGPMMPHDLTIAAGGGLLLWFGWYGFNPGSTLSAMDFVGIGRISANTTLAACAAGLTAMFTAYFMNRIWDVSFTVNGFLAVWSPSPAPATGSVPRVPSCSAALPASSSSTASSLLEYLRIDDPIGAVPVHGICGIWGTLSLGLFACGSYGATGPISPDNSAPLKGLFYGGGTTLLKAQCIGSFLMTTATFGVSLILMYAVNAMGLLRVFREGELHGLDLHEHGISAYPEYVITALGSPEGMREPVGK